ncbi:MAG: glucose-6-phosphate dehydrogenase assembly protein OpcA [Chthoniobacteraceae bacterium]
MALDPAAFGTPVEVAGIARELRKLWQADQTRTRASLINFAIICQGEAAMQDSTELLARFVRNHAFRALLIGIDPAAAETSVRAWVNAHCYLPKAGAKHVCCEQVSIFVQGKVRELLPNLLFSQLDYDLPLTLWWRCECPELVDPELWRWVDRLIFDSRAWREPRKQFAALRDAVRSSRTVLCDLNWMRSLHLRQALAQMFDTPEGVAALHQLRRVSITHAPGARTTALFVLGWLAAQLGWSSHGFAGQRLTFTTDESEIRCELTEAEGPSISRASLETDTLHVLAEHPPQADYLTLSVNWRDGRGTRHLLPADSDDLADILDEELASGGRHRVYLKALAAAESLL